MSYTLQLHGEKWVYPVPEGLYELLSDISREVLRAQPEQIVPFIAEYLSALVTTREAAKDAIKIVDETLDTDLMKYCVSLKTTPDRVLWAVRVIQRALRRYFARKFLATTINKAAVITDNRDMSRRKLMLLRKGIAGFKTHYTARADELGSSSKDNAELMDLFLQKHNITYLQAHYAAIVIQKAWRGYHIRKTLRVRRVPHVGKEPEEAKPELEKYAPSWANSWLTLFEKAEPPVTPFVKGKIFPVRSPSQVFLPRREITVNRHILQTMFGENEDYDEMCDGASRVTSPALSFSPQPSKFVPDEEYLGEGYVDEYGEQSEVDIIGEDEGSRADQSTSKRSVKITSSKSSVKSGSLKQITSKDRKQFLSPSGSMTNPTLSEPKVTSASGVKNEENMSAFLRSMSEMESQEEDGMTESMRETEGEEFTSDVDEDDQIE